VGETGDTVLYERPSGSGEVWPIWVHANSKLIGNDLQALFEKKNPLFWKIVSGVIEGKESKGYYPWEDADGNMRDKFMVCTPIEGTHYVIAAATYIDEFTVPVKNMEQHANKLTKKIKIIVYIIMGITFIIIASIVFLYSFKLSKRIKSLTDHVERISVGELDATIEIKVKDEIGDLAEAITRMQDSIRFSIEQLRSRE
jgi:methyl-accepting chemotaxis protein